MYFLAIFVGVIGIVYGAYECTESNTWVNLPNVPVQTGEVSSAVIGTNLYMAGEENTKTYKYDLSANKWSQVADRLYQGNHQNAIVYDNEWWVIGGIDEMSYGRVQVYSPSDNKWRREADLPWDGGSVCAEIVGDSIIACGGIWLFKNGTDKSGTNTTNKCASYNLKSGGNWEMMKTVMPNRRNHAATGVDKDGLIWIFGGREGKNIVYDGFPTVQTYNVTDNKWRTSNDSDHPYEDMVIGRGGIGNAVYNDGKFYIFGGETKDNPGGYATNNNVYPRVDIYDTNANKWSSGKNMPYPRHGIFPVLYDNAIYIAGGGPHDGHYVSSTFDKYCL